MKNNIRLPFITQDSKTWHQNATLIPCLRRSGQSEVNSVSRFSVMERMIPMCTPLDVNTYWGTSECSSFTMLVYQEPWSPMERSKKHWVSGKNQKRNLLSDSIQLIYTFNIRIGLNMTQGSSKY